MLCKSLAIFLQCSAMKNKWILFFPVLLLACTKPQQQITCSLPVTVSYSNDVQTIFNTQCATSGCHTGSSPTGNLNLSTGNSYAQLSKKGSGYIDTITPTNSLLYAQMNSSSSPMPPSGKLDDCKIQLVLKWLQQKARNN